MLEAEHASSCGVLKPLGHLIRPKVVKGNTNGVPNWVSTLSVYFLPLWIWDLHQTWFIQNMQTTASLLASAHSIPGSGLVVLPAHYCVSPHYCGGSNSFFMYSVRSTDTLPWGHSISMVALRPIAISNAADEPRFPCRPDPADILKFWMPKMVDLTGISV